MALSGHKRAYLNYALEQVQSQINEGNFINQMHKNVFPSCKSHTEEK